MIPPFIIEWALKYRKELGAAIIGVIAIGAVIVLYKQVQELNRENGALQSEVAECAVYREEMAKEQKQWEAQLQAAQDRIDQTSREILDIRTRYERRIKKILTDEIPKTDTGAVNYLRTRAKEAATWQSSPSSP